MNLYGYVNGNPVQYVDPGVVIGLMEMATPLWVITTIARMQGADLQVNPYLQAIDDGLAVINISKGVIEFAVKNGDNIGRLFLKGGSELALKGTKYSAEYAQKLKNTYKVFQENGYEIGEHGLNRIFGRINQGKIESVDQVFDALKTGTKYFDTVEGGTVLFKNGVSIHIAEDGFIKSVIGEAKVKTTWEIIK